MSRPSGIRVRPGLGSFTVCHTHARFVELTSVIAAAPTFVTGPLAGHVADVYGAEWVIGPGLLLTIPFFALLIPQAGMVFFIVMFTMPNALLSTGIGPIGVEFAAAAKTMAHKGATEIHEFAAMNFVFGKSNLSEDTTLYRLT